MRLRRGGNEGDGGEEETGGRAEGEAQDEESVEKNESPTSCPVDSGEDGGTKGAGGSVLSRRSLIQAGVGAGVWSKGRGSRDGRVARAVGGVANEISRLASLHIGRCVSPSRRARKTLLKTASGFWKRTSIFVG